MLRYHSLMSSNWPAAEEKTTYKEVLAGCNWGVYPDAGKLEIVILFATRRQKRIDIVRGLLDGALDVDGKTRSLGEGEAEIEGAPPGTQPSPMRSLQQKSFWGKMDEWRKSHISKVVYAQRDRHL